MWNNLSIDGFSFETSAEYAEAKHEYDTISYICSKMDINNPQVALKIYYKLLERQNLHTIVGLTFLKKLRDIAVESGAADPDELRTIHSPQLSENTSGVSETGDESALENDNEASEMSVDVPSEIEERQDEMDEVRKLNRDLGKLREKEKKLKTVSEYYRNKVKKQYIIIAALIIIIAGLFGLAIYNNNLTFADEEIVLQDKYSAWAEELKAKEAELNEREKLIEFME